MSTIEAARRGRLVLADKVIEKIAGQAAAEIGAAHGRSGGLLGIGAESDSQARPNVDVDLGSDSADLAISVGIAYPGSIRQATQQIREHVTQRVENLTGVRVRRVDIDVAFLATPGTDGHREVLR
ncbi:MAG TPA: Asp23/Gls24 family envelope stress response protein [Propionibacteriaceae bacterium]